MVRGNCFSQSQAVRVGVGGQVNPGDGFSNAGRRAQRADAGREVQAVFRTQTQSAQFGRLDAAVNGRAGEMALVAVDGIVAATEDGVELRGQMVCDGILHYGQSVHRSQTMPMATATVRMVVAYSARFARVM